MSWRHEPGAVYFLDSDNKDRNRPFYLFNGYSNRGYHMAKKVPASINAIICVAIHSGSHSSQRPTSLMARAIRMKACHKDSSAWKPLQHSRVLYLNMQTSTPREFRAYTIFSSKQDTITEILTHNQPLGHSGSTGPVFQVQRLFLQQFWSSVNTINSCYTLTNNQIDLSLARPFYLPVQLLCHCHIILHKIAHFTDSHIQILHLYTSRLPSVHFLQVANLLVALEFCNHYKQLLYTMTTRLICSLLDNSIFPQPLCHSTLLCIISRTSQTHTFKLGTCTKASICSREFMVQTFASVVENLASFEGYCRFTNQ